MGLKNSLVILSFAALLLIETQLAKGSDAGAAEITEIRIKKEIGRLAPLLEEIEKANLNITIVFSNSKFDEDGETVVQYDSVELRPLSSKYNPDGPKVIDQIDEDHIKKISKFAKQHNMSAVASREVFSEDGSLYSKDVFIENMKISYADGNSHAIIKDINVREQEFEDFVNMMKDYELPVEVHKTLYSEDGELLKTDTAEYKPKKVRIEVGDMQIARQLKVAEALKRSCIMKEEGSARLKLLVRYLDIQFPNFSWEAVMGGGDHFIYSDEWLKLSFDGELYIVWANKK